MLHCLLISRVLSILGTWKGRLQMTHMIELVCVFVLAVAVMSNTGLSSQHPEIASGSSSTKPLLDRYGHELA